MMDNVQSWLTFAVILAGKVRYALIKRVCLILVNIVK